MIWPVGSKLVESGAFATQIKGPKTGSQHQEFANEIRKKKVFTREELKVAERFIFHLT